MLQLFPMSTPAGKLAEWWVWEPFKNNVMFIMYELIYWALVPLWSWAKQQGKIFSKEHKRTIV